MNTGYIINTFTITLQFTEYDASSNVKDFLINDRNDNFEAFEFKHILWVQISVFGSQGAGIKQMMYVEYKHQNALRM
jgi:hypothetical protein